MNEIYYRFQLHPGRPAPRDCGHAGQDIAVGLAHEREPAMDKPVHTPQHDDEQEMEWEHAAREAVQDCLDHAQLQDPDTILVGHPTSCGCTNCLERPGPEPFTKVEDLLSTLVEVAGSAWSSYVPFEHGVAVFEFDASDWQFKIQGMMEDREVMAQWVPWSRWCGENGFDQAAKLSRNVPYQHRGAAARVVTRNGQVRPQNQKLLVYVMHDGDHPFLVMRRTEQNTKGKYVTRDEFLKVGLCWPNPFVKSRDEMALKLGQALLDEAGV